MASRALATLRRGLKGIFVGYSGGQSFGYGGIGSFFRPLPGTNFDYRREAGWLHDNSIVLAGVNFKTRCLQGTPITVMKRQMSDKRAIPLYDHEITQLIRKPTPWYDRSILLQSLILADDTAGDAFLHKGGDRIGRLTRLTYLPWYCLAPKNDKYNPDLTELITYYLYSVMGCTKEILPEEIIRIRQGMDPLDLKRGLSPLGAGLREIVGDNGAATWAAAMVRNYGIPPTLITPDGEDTEEFQKDQREELERKWIEKTTGDRRGEPMVANIPLKIQQLGLNKDQMGTDDLSARAEFRITSLQGLNTMVLGLSAGNSRNTYANYEQAYRAAWETCLVPTQVRFGDQLTAGLEDFLGPNEFIGFDNSENKALNEDVDDLHTRAQNDYRAGIIDRWMAKIMIGEKPEPKDRGVYATPGGPTGPNEPQEEPTTEPGQGPDAIDEDEDEE